MDSDSEPEPESGSESVGYRPAVEAVEAVDEAACAVLEGGLRVAALRCCIASISDFTTDAEATLYWEDTSLYLVRQVKH